MPWPTAPAIFPEGRRRSADPDVWLGFRGEVRDVYTGARNFSLATPAPRVHNIVTSGGLVLRF